MSIYSTISYNLRSYGIPALITIGIILNTMSFLVLKRIKSSSTAQYMSFLGLVDTGVLLSGAFSIWLHYINLDGLPFISWLGCKLTMFIFYTLADYSVLIIVIMTAERFYGVWKPVHANKWTKKRFSLITSFLFCCFVNSHFIFTHSIVEYPDSNNELVKNLSDNETISMNTSSCEFIMWKEFYEKYWIFIDATIYSFIPFVAITLFNILIIRFLNKAEKVNRQLTSNRPLIKNQIVAQDLVIIQDSQNIKYIDDMSSNSALVILYLLIFLFINLNSIRAVLFSFKVST